MRPAHALVTLGLLAGAAACASGGSDVDASGSADARAPADAAGNVDSAPGPDAPGAIDAAVDADTTDADTTDADTTDADPSSCDVVVDLFPVPVSTATSPFPSIDDAVLEVTFTQGFTFAFYGQTYTSVFLNSNGGMTFGAGESSFDLAVADVVSPGIGVFWGDMDAAAHGADTRPNQMVYQQCADRFVVSYTQLQDHDNAAWNNTATATLRADGTIEIDYGQVLTEDLFVAVFDGTHASDTAAALQASYDYTTMGSGVVIFDHFGAGPSHAGQLTDQTITFTVP